MRREVDRKIINAVQNMPWVIEVWKGHHPNPEEDSSPHYYFVTEERTLLDEIREDVLTDLDLRIIQEIGKDFMFLYWPNGPRRDFFGERIYSRFNPSPPQILPSKQQ